MTRSSGIWAAALLAACVPYPGETPLAPPLTPILSGPFQSLDPGASQLDSLHFRVRAYGPDAARQVSEIAEQAYNGIMVDTNLFSFKPRGLYEIVVYGGPDEYRRKTGQPEWSGGAAVGNAIYTYFSPHMALTLSHEMTHLIFFEFMGRSPIETRWINEGLACYEEGKAASAAGRPVDLFANLRLSLRQQPLPMENMLRLVPATEKQHTVNLWYAQAESMIRYMVERGGRIGFSQFLEALKIGKNLDQAVAAGFPGVWRDLADFEQAWRRSL